MRMILVCSLASLLCSTANAQQARPLIPIAAKLEPTRLEVYKTVGQRSLRLHLFEPEGHQATDHRSVFLIIHGGGWTGGNPRQFYPFADQLAQAGMIGISLEYRLMNRAAGTTVFDCVKDGRSAIRYIRANANKLGIDPNRIVAAGGSAGGHVAVATALFNDVNEVGEETSVSASPNAVVLYYPVIDTSKKGYGQKKIGDRWKELSPVHNVKQGLPPTILFHGTGDTVTPFAGAVEFQRRMKAAGNHCELIRHEGGAHGYLIFDLKLYEQTIKRTKQFLAEQKMIPAD